MMALHLSPCSLSSFVKVMTRELTELKTSVQFSQTELHEMRNNYKTENDKERYDHRSLQKLTADLRRMDDTIDYLENQSRRNNLRIDGVKERAEETWADTEQALRKVLETDLKMPADHVKAIAIERAHRTGGAQNADRDRTVIVKFTNFKERDSVLQAARANRPRGVFVNEDFSMRVVSRRKELIPEMKEARDRGKIAYLSYDRLVHDQGPPGASPTVNKHIVALPTQLCQNHCLIHHNVVRHECITCIIILKDFIYYSIFVSHCMFHFNKQLFLVALLHFFVFSQFHFVTLVFFVLFCFFSPCMFCSYQRTETTYLNMSF